MLSSVLVVKGEASKFDWVCLGATEVTLNGEILSETGSKLLKRDSTTNYVLVAKNDNDTVAINFKVEMSSAIRTTFPSGKQNLIPGTIKSTYFDQGGEGVAYHDMTAENNGTGIRQDQGVDTEFQLAEGSIGGISTGEWLEYTVNVIEDGFFNFEIKMASKSSLGKFHLEFDGMEKSGLISVPNTGAYSKFQVVKIPGISLKKGNQVMRIYFDKADYNMGTITSVKGITTDITQKEISNEIKIYPTITQDYLSITGIIGRTKYCLLNLLGQVQKKGILINDQKIDLEYLNSGNYLIRFEDSKRVITEKFIKL